MARFTFILVASLLASVVSAAPLPAAKRSSSSASSSAAAATATSSATSTSTAAGAFVSQAYSAFQISDGTGGDAQAQANAVFVDPFNGVDLSTVSSDTLDAIDAMREAAESAETDDFDPQIDAASGATAAALQVGKIKNKVLKLTGEIQAINIKIAQAQASGSDTSSLESDLSGEQTKLTSNIQLDQANAGQTSQGVA